MASTTRKVSLEKFTEELNVLLMEKNMLENQESLKSIFWKILDQQDSGARDKIKILSI